MRIDLNTTATNGAEPAAGPSNPNAGSRRAGESGTSSDTATFFADKIQARALAPSSAQQVEGSRLRLEALRQAVSAGSYRVAPSDIAASIFAESKRARA